MADVVRNLFSPPCIIIYKIFRALRNKEFKYKKLAEAMYEKDKLSKSRYQPLVKYLLTEDFSFQVRASEDFEHL